MDSLSVFLDVAVFLLFIRLSVVVIRSQRQEDIRAMRELIRSHRDHQKRLHLKKVIELQQRFGHQMMLLRQKQAVVAPPPDDPLEFDPHGVERGGQPEPTTDFYFKSIFDGIWNEAVLTRGWNLTPREYVAIDDWLFAALEHTIVSAADGILVLGFERAIKSSRDSRGNRVSDPPVDLAWEDLDEVVDGLRSLVLGVDGAHWAMPDTWKQVSLEQWILRKAAEMRRAYIEGEPWDDEAQNTHEASI